MRKFLSLLLLIIIGGLFNRYDADTVIADTPPNTTDAIIGDAGMSTGADATTSTGDTSDSSDSGACT